MENAVWSRNAGGHRTDAPQIANSSGLKTCKAQYSTFDHSISGLQVTGPELDFRVNRSPHFVVLQCCSAICSCVSDLNFGQHCFLAIRSILPHFAISCSGPLSQLTDLQRQIVKLHRSEPRSEEHTSELQ